MPRKKEDRIGPFLWIGQGLFIIGSTTWLGAGM
jgi:hypothetical protein